MSGRQTYKDDSITIFHIDNPPYKVIVLGDAEVGKTSLVRTHTKAKFDSAYHTTVGVNIAKETLKANGKDIGLLIWDIAGQGQFYMLHKAYFQGASGIVFVFDLTRSATLSNIKNIWWKQCTDYGVGSVPAVLVGNKSDLKTQIQVIKPAALNMAKTLGDIPYFETSAKTGDAVDVAFVKLCELMQAAYE
nr:Rab family GTPase [Candidatus Sigynarchaeota archaeon]